MRIVNIELDWAEEILNPVVLDVATVDEVLVLAADDDLPGDGHLIVVLVSERRLLLVSVVEGDGDCGLGDASLAVLVDQFLQVGCSDVAQVGDTEEEADGIQNVAFSWPARDNYRSEIFNISTYPFRPVMALNWWSNPLISVLCP